MNDHPLTPFSTTSGHRWRFHRVGGCDLARIESADDLRHLRHLDQKLWAALACPARDVGIDEKTLTLIDTDGDGRIRVPEIISAVEWVCEALHDPAIIFGARDTLPLDAIRDTTLLQAARQILATLGTPDADRISLAEVADTARIFANTRFNGDGVIIPASAEDDPETARLIDTIIDTLGSVTDRSGSPGIDSEKVIAFYSELEAFDRWTRIAEENAAAILPLGDATAEAARLIDTLRVKIDDFFGRCRLANFDARSVQALNRQEDAFFEIAARDLSITSEELRDFPLAHVASGSSLPLDQGVNPGWSREITAFRDRVVRPLLGPDRRELTEADWRRICDTFEPFLQWQQQKRGHAVEPLGITRVRALLAGDGREKLAELIRRDLALEPTFNAIASLERLLRFSRDLYRLLRNFVSFVDFFDPERLAIFQAGTLYLDSRACKLVVRVRDPARHAALAGLSRAYLAYLDCIRPGSHETLQIVAAITAGDADNLTVGRNGVFYDSQGRDWDATITRIVENPISIRQAFWSPYKRLIRFVEEQLAKRAAAADAAAVEKLAHLAGQANASAAQPVARESRKIDVGTVAALGVAVSGFVATITAIISAILGLGPWIPVAVLGVMLLISGPSMLVAAFKLRQRNLGPILDANGWAINGRVRINIPFGRTLTETAKLPPGAERTFAPFQRRKTLPWGVLVLLAILAVLTLVHLDKTRRGHYFWQPPVENTQAPTETAP